MCRKGDTCRRSVSERGQGTVLRTRIGCKHGRRWSMSHRGGHGSMISARAWASEHERMSMRRPRQSIRDTISEHGQEHGCDPGIGSPGRASGPHRSGAPRRRRGRSRRRQSPHRPTARQAPAIGAAEVRPQGYHGFHDRRVGRPPTPPKVRINASHLLPLRRIESQAHGPKSPSLAPRAHSRKNKN